MGYAGTAFTQARQIASGLALGRPVLCITKTRRQAELMRLLVEEILADHFVDSKKIDLLEVRHMEKQASKSDP